jgi:hypothetical protein
VALFLVGEGDESTRTPTGSPPAVTHRRLPQHVAGAVAGAESVATGALEGPWCSPSQYEHSMRQNARRM